MAATAVPLLPFDTWPASITQAATPANDNALRAEVIAKPALSFQASQPSLTSPGDDGELYVLSAAWGDEVTGTLALFTGSTWYYFVPFDGMVKEVGGTPYQYSSGAWAAYTVAATVQDAVSALTNSAGTVTVDCSLGKSFTITLAANVTTLTLTNLAGPGFSTEIEIEIKQNGTGGFTFALPASFKALGGSDTAIASAANAVTVISAKTFDNGTTWRYAMQESA